jgi:hypothetical protein
LGVLCDLAIQSGEVSLTSVTDDIGVCRYVANGIEYGGLLPPDVQIWAGLTTPSGGYLHPTTTDPWALIHDNDMAARTFDHIAAIIDAEPVGLCTQWDAQHPLLYMVVRPCAACH